MAIIRYKETFIGITNMVFAEVYHPNHVRRILTNKQAKERIAKQGLVLAYEDDELGEVWDTPDRRFYNKYHGIKVENI